MENGHAVTCLHSILHLMVGVEQGLVVMTTSRIFSVIHVLVLRQGCMEAIVPGQLEISIYYRKLLPSLYL